MDELERASVRRVSDREAFRQRPLRRLGDRNAGLELEAGVIGRGIDRHRGPGGLHALLVERLVELLERLDQRVEGRIPVGRALAEHEGLRRQHHVLAERIGGPRLARRGRGLGKGWRPRQSDGDQGERRKAHKHCSLPFEGRFGTILSRWRRVCLPNPAALRRSGWRRAVLSPYNLARNQHPMSALANHAFVKMYGLGNEIVVVDMRAAPAPIPADEARAAAQPAGAPYDQMMALYP